MPVAVFTGSTCCWEAGLAARYVDHDHCVPHLTSNVSKYCALLECNHHSRCRREFVLTSLSFEPDLAGAADKVQGAGRRKFCW